MTYHEALQAEHQARIVALADAALGFGEDETAHYLHTSLDFGTIGRYNAKSQEWADLFDTWYPLDLDGLTLEDLLADPERYAAALAPRTLEDWVLPALEDFVSEADHEELERIFNRARESYRRQQAAFGRSVAKHGAARHLGQLYAVYSPPTGLLDNL